MQTIKGNKAGIQTREKFGRFLVSFQPFSNCGKNNNNQGHVVEVLKKSEIIR